MGDGGIGLATSLATFAFAAGSPGPATLAVAGTSMAKGRRHGVALALGLSLGLAAWGVLAGLGLDVVIAHFAPALVALKLAGAAFLFYLAWKSGCAALTPSQSPGAATSGGAGQVFWRGVWLNLLNPKAALAWVAALALGSGGTVAVALCALIGLAFYLFYATVFSLRGVMAAYARAARWIEAFFAGFFALAGLRLLTWRAGQ